MTHHDEPRPDPAVSALLTPLRAEHTARHLSASRAAALWPAIERRGAAPRSVWPWIGAGLAFAAASVIAGLLWTATPPESTRQPDAAPVVVAGATLSAPARAPSGATISPLEGATLTVLAAEPSATELRIDRGAVRSQVPSLAAGQRYVVHSPVAQVEVRGTDFVVDARPDGSTRVTVTEGLVQVRPDGDRPIRAVPAGRATVVEPLSEAGARRAQSRGEQEAAARIWGYLMVHGPDGPARRNKALRVGASFEHHPAAAALFWQRVRDTFRDGLHAEAFAFRAADALRRAGQHAEAREAAARFRAGWPDSPRAAETAGW